MKHRHKPKLKIHRDKEHGEEWYTVECVKCGAVAHADDPWYSSLHFEDDFEW